MSEEVKNEDPAEEVPVKERPREVRYTSVQATELCKEILIEAKIKFLDVRVTSKELIITAPGKIDNVREVAELFVRPALFGVDGAKKTEDLLSVTELDDGVGGVANTRLILYRTFAEKVYEGAGPDEDEEVE